MEAWVAPVISGLLAGLLTAAGAWIAFRIRFERFQSMDEEREESWTTWRAALEERISRIDAREQNHEKDCRDRWERLMLEHGAIMADLRRREREAG